MHRILIIGCGDLGIKLGLLLCSMGYEVWGARRHPDAIPTPIHSLKIDLHDSLCLDLPAYDWRAVYIILTADNFSNEGYHRTYVLGIQNLINRLINHERRPRFIYFVSSTSVYGQNEGEWVDENTPAIPRSFSGKRLREAEELICSCGIPSVIVRFGGIYGLQRLRLLERVRTTQSYHTADKTHYLNLIHETDVIGILLHLLKLSHPESLYLGVDGQPILTIELIKWLANRMGITQLIEIFSDEGPSSFRYQNNKRCRNTRLLESGYQFVFPAFCDGYNEILVNL